MLHWTPTDGETVHINPRNPWGLASGRYRLTADADCPGDWFVRGITSPGWLHVHGAALRLQERATVLTPIPADELERERQRLQLAARAPLRRMVAQHDASGLGLFRAANEPRLL